MTNARQLTSYILLAVGALWLLIEAGFVPARLTLALLDWWPLLLVAGGLDLLVPTKNRGPVPIVAYAGAAILVIGALGLSGSHLVDANSLVRPTPPGATSLTARIELGSAITTIAAAPAGQLVNAQFDGQQPARAQTSGTTDLTLDIQGGLRRPFDLRPSSWSIGLSQNLPLDLTLRSGSGRTTLDLSSLRLRALRLNAGSGAVTLNLPGDGHLYQAELSGGSGRLVTHVSAGASLDLSVHAGSGGLNLTVGEGADLQLLLSARSGKVDIDLPDDAPARLEVRNDGSGRLRLPDYLVRRSGQNDSGVWQSPAYEHGGRVIDITLIASGSGDITFR